MSSRAASPARLSCEDDSGATRFDVEAAWIGPSLAFRTSGRLDAISAPRLLELFNAQTGEMTPENITIDLTDLAFMSSAGIRTLMIIVKRVGQGKVSLINPNEHLQEVLDKTAVSILLSQ